MSFLDRVRGYVFARSLILRFPAGVFQFDVPCFWYFIVFAVVVTSRIRPGYSSWGPSGRLPILT
jgi:hypothetical protein